MMLQYSSTTKSANQSAPSMRLRAAGHASRQPLHIWKSLPWTLEGSRRAKGHESMTESPTGEREKSEASAMYHYIVLSC
jgi:hypothetical protein